jgi:hypothetical protein
MVSITLREAVQPPLKVWAVIVRNNGLKRPIFAAREANAISTGVSVGGCIDTRFIPTISRLKGRAVGDQPAPLLSNAMAASAWGSQKVISMAR